MFHNINLFMHSDVRDWYVALKRVNTLYTFLMSHFLDHKTDSIIQSSLRNELSSDVTVLTVAHRLQTIMDADKIVCVISRSMFCQTNPAF